MSQSGASCVLESNQVWSEPSPTQVAPVPTQSEPAQDVGQHTDSQDACPACGTDYAPMAYTDYAPMTTACLMCCRSMPMRSSGEASCELEKSKKVEKAAAEEGAAEKAAAENAAAEKVEAQNGPFPDRSVSAQKVAADKAAAEKAEAQNVAAENAEAEKAEPQMAEAEKVAAEKVEAKKADADAAARTGTSTWTDWMAAGLTAVAAVSAAVVVVAGQTATPTPYDPVGLDSDDDM